MGNIVKAFLLKWLQAGQSREMAISALGLLVILFGEQAGLEAVAHPVAKLAVALVCLGAVGGIVAMKYIEALKIPQTTLTATTGVSGSTMKGGGDVD